jgi:hypothetical protein
MFRIIVHKASKSSSGAAAQLWQYRKKAWLANLSRLAKMLKPVPKHYKTQH